jgi:hypothetical protein
MSTSWWITPTLMLGALPAKIYRAKRVSSPDEALSAVQAGYTAVLPDGAWEAATRVLLDLGLSRHDAEDRIRFARTGATA